MSQEHDDDPPTNKPTPPHNFGRDPAHILEQKFTLFPVQGAKLALNQDALLLQNPWHAVHWSREAPPPNDRGQIGSIGGNGSVPMSIRLERDGGEAVLTFNYGINGGNWSSGPNHSNEMIVTIDLEPALSLNSAWGPSAGFAFLSASGSLNGTNYQFRQPWNPAADGALVKEVRISVRGQFYYPK